MSADLTTVKQVIEALSKLPPDALVVSFGIDGCDLGEKLDGVEIYSHRVKEGRDGFIPIKPDIPLLEQVDDPAQVLNAVVIASCSQDLLIEWCFDDED